MTLGRLSLRYRIALVIFLLEACLLAAVLTVSLSQSRATASQFNTASQKASLELLANLSVTALLTGEYSDYQLYIDDMRKQPSIVHIILADPQLRVVASTQVAEVGQTIARVMDQRQAGWQIVPVSSAAGTLGTLAVRFSDAALVGAYRNTRNLALLIAIGGVLITALVGLGTGFALTRRLQHVAEAARRFSGGDTSARSDVQGNDEVALLAQDVNRMADVTVQHQRALREQSAYIELLMNSTAEAIYGVDTRGICTFVNQACLRMLGYSHENEIVGREIHSLIHHTYPDGSFYPKEECRVRLSSLQGRSAHADDELHWRKDGSSFPVEYWSHPIYHDDKLIGAVVTFIDVTQRKQAEQAMAHKNRMLGTVAATTEVFMHEQGEHELMTAICRILVERGGFRMAWIGLIQPDGCRVAPVAEHGFDEGYLAAADIRCDDSPQGRGPTGCAIRQGETIINDDTETNPQFAPWRDRARTQGYRSSAAAPLRLNGQTVGALNVYSATPHAFGEDERALIEKLAADIGYWRERKHAEAQISELNAELEQRVRERTAQLEAANKELEAFSYSVSHDLRAPLRAVDGFSQALIEDYGDQLDSVGRNYLQRLRAGAQNMGALIDDMLKLARVTRAPLQPETIDLSSLAHDVVARMREEAPARQVQVDIASGMRCRADPGLMRVVMENLLGNAWKYTARTELARISVSVDEQGGNAVFQVRDNGVGFDMKYAGKLFGAFQRLHRKEEFEGTGIGLATVQRIVRRHGGQVWAEATPGGGAAFFFTLGHPEQ